MNYEVWSPEWQIRQGWETDVEVWEQEKEWEDIFEYWDEPSY